MIHVLLAHGDADQYHIECNRNDWHDLWEKREFRGTNVVTERAKITMSRTTYWPLLELTKQRSAVKRVAEYNSAASTRMRRTGIIVLFGETRTDATLRSIIQIRYARSPSIPLNECD